MKKYIAILILCLCSQSKASGAALLGDIDGNGVINMADVRELADIVLGKKPYGGGIEYVDFDMGDGILWATCNVGAITPSDYGEYFAWGETEMKAYYDLTGYAWYLNGKYTRYCLTSTYGTVDNRKYLLPEDDAAYVNLGYGWHIPTFDDWANLKSHCLLVTSERDGVKGFSAISLKDNKEIFFPYSGFCHEENIYNIGEPTFYWANRLYPYNSSVAYGFYVDVDYKDWAYRSRYIGYPIRPVLYPILDVCDINGDLQVSISDVSALVTTVLCG